MIIKEGIEIFDLSLFLKKEKILIIGDVHIGKEAEMRSAGVLIPRFQYKEILENTQKILKKTNPKLIILNGDIKHSFGEISRDEWKYVSEYLDFLGRNSKVILIKGNHDNILGPIAQKSNVEIRDYFKINDVYICHGHLLPEDDDFKKSKTIIIGHQHPAVSLQDGARFERYKCFLKGKYKTKTLIVMPAFSPLSSGNDVLTEKSISPLIDDTKIKNFEVFIVEDKIYYFGKLKNLEKL